MGRFFSTIEDQAHRDIIRTTDAYNDADDATVMRLESAMQRLVYMVKDFTDVDGCDYEGLVRQYLAN